MRFRIDAAPDAGLRVISEIPDGELVQIEGRNGIGKTLAVRLLQLVTTSQPFAGRSQSWTTLKAHLNPVTIRVDGLRDGHGLRFELDPEEWPADPRPPGPWLGEVFLDDQPLDWSTVPSILRVRRIGGDETLGESLAAQVATDAELLQQTVARQKLRRDDWNDRLAAIRLLTDVPAAFDFGRLRDADAKARKDLDVAKKALEAVRDRFDLATEAANLTELRRRISTDEPLLRDKIKQLTADETRLRREASELDSQAATILARGKQTDEVSADLDRLMALQRKRLDRRERRRRDLTELCRRADLSVPVDLTAAQRQASKLKADRRSLEEQRQTVDRAGLMLELLDSIELPIDRGVASRLGEEIVAQITAGPLKLAEFADGVAARRVVLQGYERVDGSEILNQIAAIDRQIAASEDLADAVRLLDKAEADVADTSSTLSKILETLSQDVAGEYESVSDTRAERLDALTRLVEERAQAENELEGLLAHGDGDQVEQRARDIAAQLEATVDLDDPDQWTAWVVELGDLVEQKVRVHLSAIAARDLASASLRQAESGVRGATAELHSSPRFGWLLSEEIPLPDPSSGPEEQVESLLRLGTAAGRLEELLLRTLNDQQSLQQTLTNLADRLRASGTAGQLQQGNRGELAPSVDAYYEQRFAQELSAEMVRTSLFAGGTDIAVDLKTMSTSWTLPNGQRNTRPLEAFSSGERAFAYTRVQVERLADEPAANRVVFLDEFGSFVAHDRFDQLKRYLRTQALGRAADKIVVILPLRKTPSDAEEAELARRGGFLVSELDG